MVDIMFIFSLKLQVNQFAKHIASRREKQRQITEELPQNIFIKLASTVPQKAESKITILTKNQSTS